MIQQSNTNEPAPGVGEVFALGKAAYFSAELDVAGRRFLMRPKRTNGADLERWSEKLVAPTSVVISDGRTIEAHATEWTEVLAHPYSAMRLVFSEKLVEHLCPADNSECEDVIVVTFQFQRSEAD